MYFRVNMKMKRPMLCCCFTSILFFELIFTVAFLLIRKIQDDQFASKVGDGGFLEMGGILVKGETPLWTMLFERSMKKSLHCFLLITIPIYTMPICNNKYIFGSELQNPSDSICNGYFLDIMSNRLWRQFSHSISPSSSKCFLCVKNLA